MSSRNAFRQLDRCPGSFLTIGSPVVTEIAVQYPFTWLLLDMEHGGFNEHNLADHLRSFTHRDMMSIVRVPAVDPVLIGRVLDMGADGIMLPHVVSVAQLDACRQAMFYPPEGRRGFSSSTRQFNYGVHTPADIAAVDKPLLFAQIEDVEGVLNVDAIAAVTAVDVLFVGPADLKLALKHHPGKDMDYDTALQAVANAAKAHRKKAGILVRDRSVTGELQQLGYNCIAIDSDIAILRSGYAAIFKEFRKD